eukprot:TRINITY_DN8967_c0_g1_i4.p1 TRINITY_DN8967_c0_g1~~TRINITY_DN8967_c0_g1_i4.p1  ORF type:complete len:141 (+),score=9.09 TRINITY_DN8967_c0_g1_i4:969-1391(+)
MIPLRSTLVRMRPRAFNKDSFISGNSFLRANGVPGFTRLQNRIQQRSGRKTLTTVQGISPDYDQRRLVKVTRATILLYRRPVQCYRTQAFKKEFACNGTVASHPEYGEVIQLQGDQRKVVFDFLSQVGIAKKDQIKVHGF